LKGLCSFEGCGRRVEARGLCHAHYEQLREGRPVAPLKPNRGAAPAAPCSFGGCGRPASARGLCDAHYSQQQRGAVLAPLRARGLPNRIEVEGPVAWIYLTDADRHEVARTCVDVDRLPDVIGRRWVLAKSTGSVLSGSRGRRVILYRLLMGATDPAVEVDHVNGDRLDQRLANLRLVSRAEQAQNVVRPSRPPAMRNVHRHRDGGWEVVVTVGGVRHRFGPFEDTERAKQAARDARARLFTHANEERHR
jgi:hypothetical protein